MAGNPISRALSDPKARTLLIAIVIAVIVVISIAISRIREASNGPVIAGKSAVSGAPVGRLDPTPGNPNAPQEYKKLQVIENKIRLQEAEETGKSAIPTLIRENGGDEDNAFRNRKAKTDNKDAARPNPQAELAQLYQQQLLSQQKQTAERQKSLQQERDSMDVNQRLAAAEGLMKGQMSALFERWAPPHQVYVSGGAGAAEKDNTPTAAGALAGKGNATAAPAAEGQIFAKSGDIFYAVLETGVNSDTPSPVMARIVDGPFKGAKAIGSLTRQDDRVVLHFTTLNVQGMPRSIGFNAVAIDTETAHTALASDVDHHYLLRYGTLFASSFLAGAATTLQGASTNCFFGVCTTSGGGTALSNLSNGQKIVYSGLGQVGTRLSQDTNLSNMSPTVTVDSGTGVGLLLLADLTTTAPPVAPEAAPKLTLTPATAPSAQSGVGQANSGFLNNAGLASTQLAQSLSSSPLGNTNTAQNSK